MLAVGLSEEEVLPYLERINDNKRIVLACCNSPESVTLSGDRSALVELAKEFATNAVFARLLQVDVAYHSPFMQVIADRYLVAIEHIRPRVTAVDVTMLSTVTGRPIKPSELDASYWVQNMCSPVRFLQALKAALPAQKRSTRRSGSKAASIDGMVEIGPHSALKGPLRQTLQGLEAQAFYLSMLIRGENALVTALEAAASLWCHGCPVDLRRANTESDQTVTHRVLSDLPPYPFK